MDDFDPPTAFQFELRLSGSDRVLASFQEVTGLDNEIAEEPVSEGGANAFVHRLPGVVHHGNLVCKRGVIGSVSGELGQWLTETMGAGLSGRIETKDLGLALIGPESTPVMTWEITGAWPVKWRVAPFDAVREGDALAVETLEFAYQSVVRTAVGQ